MKAREVPGLDPATPLRPNAALIVLTRLDELRSLAPAALEPKAAEAQHDMRIAAKRLRYALEILAPCFGPEAEATRDAAKRLQSVLGEVHDCDEMLPSVWGIESLRGPRCGSGARPASPKFTDLWREISPTLHTFSLLKSESGGDLTR